MNRANRLLLLEFNELCPALVEQFMGEGILPNFQRLAARSQRFITETDDAVLEPWTQWVTLHTGVPFAQHGIVDLDEAARLAHETFWDAMEDGDVLLMAPMNVRFEPRGASVFLPDPWAASQQPSPEIAPLHRFVRAAVNGHARTGKLPRKEALEAIGYLASHGLTLPTVLATIRQICAELIHGAHAKWRRAVLLDRLLWDVFEHYWESPRAPRVGVFFSNATAHYQHKYWRHHDPAAFELKPTPGELRHYGGAIRYGYRAHDRLIGAALRLADEHTSIALCTALSQQPMLDYEQRGGKAMFVPKNFEHLLRVLGCGGVRVEHIMAEESRLHFASRDAAEHAMTRLSRARTDSGQPVFKIRGFDGGSFIAGCTVFAAEVHADTRIVCAGVRHRFHDHFVRMPTTTSAKHHPDGLFWLTGPHVRASAHPVRLPLTAVRSHLERTLTGEPKPTPLVSVVIANHNYAAFVGEAIESALQLDWPRVEVIVIDDGSTDESREVIARYSDRITFLQQEKAGQLRATNRAFAHTHGDIVIFLDSDDVLHPSLIRELMAVWTPRTSKVQVQMQTIDAQGRPLGTYLPQYRRVPSSDEVRAWATHAAAYPTPPGSGNAYARWFLERIFPLEDSCGDAPDSYCLAAAPFLGEVMTVAKPLVSYRIHGRNQGAFSNLDIDRFAGEVIRAQQRRAYAVRIAAAQGVRLSAQALHRSFAFLGYRLASFRLKPETHPVHSDSMWRLLKDLLLAFCTSQGLTPSARLSMFLWGCAVCIAPRALATRLILWRFAPGRRPAPVRTMLVRLGVVRA